MLSTRKQNSEVFAVPTLFFRASVALFLLILILNCILMYMVLENKNIVETRSNERKAQMDEMLDIGNEILKQLDIIDQRVKHEVPCGAVE